MSKAKGSILVTVLLIVISVSVLPIATLINFVPSLEYRFPSSVLKLELFISTSILLRDLQLPKTLVPILVKLDGNLIVTKLGLSLNKLSGKDVFPSEISTWVTPDLSAILIYSSNVKNKVEDPFLTTKSFKDWK